MATGNVPDDLPTRVTEAVAATVDGRPIAVTIGYQTVRMRKLVTREQIGPDLHVPKPVTAVAISEDGHIIVGSTATCGIQSRRSRSSTGTAGLSG
ncbi:hypothetical protein [Nonomuraea sp. NPDC049695]|uniref:hypothetical protein n=1 Tax=Nonomuraea sp. NPDC049695 TaxID=3154734 RepID=UPI003440B051